MTTEPKGAAAAAACWPATAEETAQAAAGGAFDSVTESSAAGGGDDARHAGSEKPAAPGGIERLAGEVNRLQFQLQQLPAGAVDEFVAKYRQLLEARDRLREALELEAAKA